VLKENYTFIKPYWCQGISRKECWKLNKGASLRLTANVNLKKRVLKEHITCNVSIRKEILWISRKECWKKPPNSPACSPIVLESQEKSVERYIVTTTGLACQAWISRKECWKPKNLNLEHFTHLRNLKKRVLKVRNFWWFIVHC